MKKLLRKILYRKQHNWQFLIAGAGLWLGLLIVLVSIQVYDDYNHFQLAKKSSKDNYYYFDISKTIDLSNMMGAAKAEFSGAELDSLRTQPFIADVAPYTRSGFTIDAELEFDIGGFAPKVVFESVPNNFLDTIPEEFKWEEGKNFIPVLVYGGYLDLYNSSIAQSQGLPQLPASLVKMVPFEVTVSGNGKQEKYLARVVGFSDRISLLAVPGEFMDWANQRFATDVPLSSKVMVQVEDPGAAELKAYLKKQGYVSNSEKLRSDNSKLLLQALISVLVVIGGLFLVLSFIIFLVNFQLLLSRAKPELDILFSLGYTHGAISNIISKRFAFILFGIIASSLILLAVLVFVAHAGLESKGVVLRQGLSYYAIGLALIVYIILWGLNTNSVKRTLRS